MYLMLESIWVYVDTVSLVQADGIQRNRWIHNKVLLGASAFFFFTECTCFSLLFILYLTFLGCQFSFTLARRAYTLFPVMGHHCR